MRKLFEQHLRACLPFRPDEIRLFTDAMTPTVLEKGELFVTQGRPSDRAGFLAKGIMRLFYTREGKEYTSRYFFAGIWIGELASSISHVPSNYGLEAIVRCEVMWVRHEELLGLYEECHMIELYGRIMAEQLLVEIIRERAARIMSTPEEQYLDLISRHSEILQAVPLKQIANYLNIEPGSLSRIRRRLYHNSRLHCQEQDQ